MAKPKIKPIIPSLREKKRYLLFEVISAKKLDSDDIKLAVNKKLKECLGTFGLAEAGILLVHDKFEANQGVLRTNTKSVDKVKMALSLISKVGKEEVQVNTIKVSGILKKVMEPVNSKKLVPWNTNKNNNQIIN